MTKTFIPVKVLDKNFSKFTQATLRQRHPNQIYVISQLQNFKKQYNTSGFFSVFLLRLEDFALQMEYFGGLDIAGIVFAKLAKFPTPPELKEQFLRSALRIAQKQNDPIHTLARIVDLKKLYEKNKNPKKAYRMLFSEESVLTYIVDNYKAAKLAYKTVSKPPSTCNKYKYQLAVAKLNIAKGMKYKDAYPRLLEARELFLDIACEHKVKFVEKLLKL